MALPELPEEIIQEILSYNADFHPNFMKCHEELLIDRPCYYKRVHAGFKPGISDSPTWHNFSKRNNTGTGGIAFLNGVGSDWNGYGFSSNLVDVDEYVDLPVPYFFWNIYCAC